MQGVILLFLINFEQNRTQPHVGLGLALDALLDIGALKRDTLGW